MVAPGVDVDTRALLPFRIGATIAAAVTVSSFFRVPRAIERWRLGFMLALFVSMACLVVRASPFPVVDVWWFQQYAGSLIARGQNPYSYLYPNVYGDDAFYGAAVLENGFVAGYPYLPLTFLLGSPFVEVMGDVRYLFVALVALGGVLARLNGGRSTVAELAVLLLLFQPLSFFVVEQSWTEPLVFAAFSVTTLVVARRSTATHGWWLMGTAAGLLLATKQYTPLIALPLLPAVPRARRIPSMAVAAGVALLTMVPFAVWNLGEFWRDVVAMQFHQPFRSDALSFLVPLSRSLGRTPSAIWGFVAAGLVLAIRLRAPSSVARAVNTSAVALLAFLLFNKQAFANYYWLSGGLLVLWCCVAEREAAAESSGVTVPLAAVAH